MYVILALLLLGVLIIAHEAGHFWAARACGISVQEFSMGMGPLIAKWKSRKGTQFSIRLLPIGGYCQFYGEDEDRPDPRAFNNQAVWKRAVTAFSGPLMNFVIAFLVIALFMSLCGVSVVVPKVAKLEENAQMAGLEIGDEILAVDGMETSDSNAVAQAIADSNGDAVTLTVRRDGQTLDLTITPFYDEDDGRYRVGFSFGRENMRLPIWSSIPFSVQYNIESVKTILDALKNMVNLLPIPGLDGSRLLFLLVEAIRHKPVNRELEGAIHLAGFALLMGLMVLLTYNDIIRFFVKG